MLNWLHRLFNGEPAPEKNGERPVIANLYEGLHTSRMGRYNDNNKNYKKVHTWYQAEDLYNEKKYKESIFSFFDYITDENEQNVNVTWGKNGDFSFEIAQGSRKIHGESDGVNIIAKVPLAIMEEPKTAAMRRLLELNYSLYHSRAAIDDQTHILYMLFETEVKAASPNKMYYGLRELAIKADRHDDLLMSDFDTLKQTEHYITDIKDGEVDIKYRYFHEWISDALKRGGELNQDSFAGAIAYIYLSAIFRIDFLIVPESTLLTELEKINSIYWTKKEEVPLVERNRRMKHELQKLLTITKEQFVRSVYHSKSTFAITSPAKAEKIKEYINNSNKDAQWYIENKHRDIALNLNEYGVLYSHFIYSVPKVQVDLTIIYMAVLNANFFKDLGLKEPFYRQETNEFNQLKIEAAVDNALATFKEKYKKLKWDHGRINYDSIFDFATSFSEQIAGLNLETKRI